MIPNPVVTYSSPNADGNLKFAPVPGANGTATITVEIEDGGLDNNLSTTADNAKRTRIFEVRVQPWLRVTGNVDKDNDFDASDALLILLYHFNGTDSQIDSSKGASLLSAPEIRLNVDAISLMGDVDDDNDFDASDALLILLYHFNGTDSQIDSSKGTSSLSAAQIRANARSLGEEPVTASGDTEQAFVEAFMSSDHREELFAGAEQHLAEVPPEESSFAPYAASPVWSEVRGWIDLI